MRCKGSKKGKNVKEVKQNQAMNLSGGLMLAMFRQKIHHSPIPIPESINILRARLT